MSGRRAIVVAILCAWGVVGAARHAQAASFDIQTRAFNGAADLISLHAFDLALGTLDRVVVTIEGVLSVSGFAPPLSDPAGPVPYSYRVSAEQNFVGVGSLRFDFDTPAPFFLEGFTVGSGEGFTLFAPFHYAFAFTEATDVAGLVIATASGPASWSAQVNGSRDDFIAPHPSIPINILLAHSGVVALPGTGLPPQLLSWGSSGVMRVEYEYTPTTAPAPVPEPASLLLVGAGLAGLAVRRLRRRT